MNKFISHLVTITKHKFFVFKACIQFGIIWRGIKHDLSKYSPSEFFSSAKYFNGKKSPIEDEKAKIGYSKAWQHHKGRNTHHWQYWLDEEGGVIYPVKMPIKDVLELICDYIGAGKAYTKDKWTKSTPLDYYNLQKDKLILHDETREIIEYAFKKIALHGIKDSIHLIKIKIEGY